MNTLFFTERMVYALGWTLAHSLWQMALAGLLLSLCLSSVRRPVQRYRAAYATLLAGLAGAMGTFAWYYARFQAAAPDWIYMEDLQTVASLRYLPAANDQMAWWEQLAHWFEQYQSVVVSIWLLGFVLLALRLAGGWWLLERLRNKAVLPDRQWPSLSQLAQDFGFKRPVQLLLSHDIPSPLAFGWLKPVILFPIGLANQLSTKEVEAILRHELAHIARYDWAWNLLQSITEAIFYFHPVIWWISSVIRQERERCCDEMAIDALKGDRLTYARALMQAQAYAKTDRRTAQPGLALSANGPTKQGLFARRAYLLERIQYILLQSPQQKSMLMERMMILGLLLATLTIWGIQAAPRLPEAFTKTMEEWAPFLQQPSTVADTLPPQKPRHIERYSEDDGKRKVEMEFRDGKIARLNVDGKDIPPSEYHQYRDITERIPPTPPVPPAPPAPGMPPVPGIPAVPHVPHVPPVPPAPPARPRGNSQVRIDKNGDQNTVIVFEENGQPTEIHVKEGKVYINGQEIKEGEAIPLDYQFHFPKGDQWPELARAFEFRDFAIAPEAFEALAPQVDFHFQFEQDQLRAMAEQEKARAREHRERALRLHPAPFYHGGIPTPAPAPDLYFFHAPDFSEYLVRELRRDYLISDFSNYSVELSPKKLKVNGKKQPDNLHKKYLNMYREHTGEEMTNDNAIKIQVKGPKK